MKDGDDVRQLSPWEDEVNLIIIPDERGGDERRDRHKNRWRVTGRVIEGVHE